MRFQRNFKGIDEMNFSYYISIKSSKKFTEYFLLLTEIHYLIIQ